MDDERVEAMDALNRECRLVSVDEEKLRSLLDREQPELHASMQEKQPHIFAAMPVFIPRQHLDAIEQVVSSIEKVVAVPGFERAVLEGAPSICSVDKGPGGVFFGYDFHLGRHGLQLIEINTNAGGALLNAALASAQQTCCETAADLVTAPHAPAALHDEIFRMFQSEWQSQRGAAPLRCVAIVDENPSEQYLFPEFLIVKEMFQRMSVESLILAPDALELEAGTLRAEGRVVDLVYDRTCDFYLERHEVLRQAFESGAAVVTPHPRAYRLYADKRNLILLSDPERLASLGVAADLVKVLAATVPRTERVTMEHADDLWSRRKQLFFKPATGYGSKAAYRGAKLTRKTWASILETPYVAQALVPPSERLIRVGDAAVPLKLDVRAYAYRGRVQLFAARLYRGQTTNFRTPGGGFAPVYTERTTPIEGSSAQ
jgi:hypothetical protein